MWGNTLGWKISAVIFLLAVAIGAWLHNQMQSGSVSHDS